MLDHIDFGGILVEKINTKDTFLNSILEKSDVLGDAREVIGYRALKQGDDDKIDFSARFESSQLTIGDRYSVNANIALRHFFTEFNEAGLLFEDFGILEEIHSHPFLEFRNADSESSSGLIHLPAKDDVEGAVNLSKGMILLVSIIATADGDCAQSRLYAFCSIRNYDTCTGVI